jgi:predicted AlkP superfamily pyrophosphatase or phosphodiesterase
MGAQSSYANLTSLSAQHISQYQNIVLMVIDGMGYELLMNQSNDSVLRKHCYQRMTSVFPTTTASAITAFSTAVAPKQHAVTGWFTYLDQLDLVSAILPFTRRADEESLTVKGVAPGDFVTYTPFYNQLERKSHVFYPARIVDSDFSLFATQGAQRHGFESFPDMINQVRNQLAVPGAQYIYAYWPELDEREHATGTNSSRVRKHFEKLDEYIEQLVNSSEFKDTLLLVTADHGLIDVQEERIIQLDQYPEIYACLSQPLCGEPRVAFCYVNAGQQAKFRDLVQSNLGEVCTIVPSQTLIDQGLFGLGVESEKLVSRVGDFALIMNENYVVKDTLANEKPFTQKAIHGGLSAQELFVPLCVFSS